MKQQSTKSYTIDLLNAMIQGMMQTKEAHGFRRLNNGLFEDCLGQVYSVDLQQVSEVMTGQGNETGVLNHVVLKFKPVSVIGRF